MGEELKEEQALSRITAAVITRNEEANIGEALQTVSWADEIVVVDAFSTDRTIEIARRFTDKVHQGRYTFGGARNRAVGMCSGEWVFSLDADERCTPEAREEILRVVRDPGAADAYYVPRRNFFMGRWIRHGGWYPDYRQPQLYRKGAVVYGEESVHESYRVSGRTATLSNAIIQVPYKDMEQLLAKVQSYSSLGAAKLLERGAKGGVARGLVHGLWAFARSWVFKLGFMDGRPGFIIALASFESAFWKYAMLAEMRRREKTP